MSLSSSVDMDALRARPAFAGTDPGEMHEFVSDVEQAARAAAGAVARDVLELREQQDVEQYLLRVVQEHSFADWAALYRPSETGYRRSARTDPPGDPPEILPLELVSALFSEGVELRPCKDDVVRESLGGADLFTGFASDLGNLPLLLLIGPTAAAQCDVHSVRVLSAVTEICGGALRNVDLIERLRSQVFIDFVTGCYNRRAFDEHLTVELVRARRYERPLSLLLLDLDNFKLVNDTLGHPIGDYALRRVAEVLRSAFRSTDRVCRYGGDEFAVIFPETSHEDVLRLAERLRRQIAAIFPDAVNTHPVTASIGVAAYPLSAARPDDLVRAADGAMYRSKTNGRNQISSA